MADKVNVPFASLLQALGITPDPKEGVSLSREAGFPLPDLSEVSPPVGIGVRAWNAAEYFDFVAKRGVLQMQARSPGGCVVTNLSMSATGQLWTFGIHDAPYPGVPLANSSTVIPVGRGTPVNQPFYDETVTGTTEPVGFIISDRDLTVSFYVPPGKYFILRTPSRALADTVTFAWTEFQEPVL